MESWSLKSITEILDELNSKETGMTKEERELRLREYGLNTLPVSKRESIFVIFFRQFQSPLIYVLFGASIVVFIMREVIDGFAILFVLLFNAIVGTIQEGKAQNTLLALKKFVETNAVVLVDDKEIIMPAQRLVPGDIIILQEGERVPADARIINSNNLKVDESVLTGESKPVHKITGILEGAKLSLGEQKNLVFQGTHIVAGFAKAVVVATSLNTVIGKISKEIALVDTEIPLKTNIRYLSRLILFVVVAMSIILIFLGIGLGKSLVEMFMTAVSLSVSVIPEGLPIVVTLVLATGVWRMSKSNVLIKKLQAVEALGQARVIAVDKTGTITKNEMMVKKIYTDGKFFEVSGSGYEPEGMILLNHQIVSSSDFSELLVLGRSAGFCANARIELNDETKEWQVAGDPTEAALLVFSKKVGFQKNDLVERYPLVQEMPFDYKTKYHAVVNKIDGKTLLTVIGAPEVILGFSKKIWHQEKAEEFSSKKREELELIFNQMSFNGLRVLACAFDEKGKEKEFFNLNTLSNLTFVGFYGMEDTIRQEVKEAVKTVEDAGMRVVMITGDYELTAKTIALEAGIYREGDTILTGEDLDALSPEMLSEKINKVSVFARVSPEHKMKIIQVYKNRGEIVAMTGDGVNDAPSLVAADLGVAMGRIGTEVAKEAADIILLDDNFGNIVSAVEEGRSIYKTLKKVILYLFSTSLGEVFTIFGAILLGYPLPLLAAQIIWLNLVTDGFLVVALAMEPKEQGLLERIFKRPNKYLIDRLMVGRMFLMAVPMMLGTLFLFKNYFTQDIVKGWTMALTTLAVFQWFNAWNCRSEEKSIFRLNFFSNKFLLAAVGIVIFLQSFAIYHPFMQKLLGTTSLTFAEWIDVMIVASSIIIIEEIRKIITWHLKK